MTMSLAPFVPSRPEVVRRMLELSEAGPNDVVYDLGCGDGRIFLSAVKDFGVRKAVGYEMSGDLYRQVAREVKDQNFQSRIVIMNSDLMNADLSEATVITLYLTTSGNERLKPKLSRETNKGTRIVSHDFEFRGWHPSIKDFFQGHIIYLYIIPEAFQT